MANNLETFLKKHERTRFPHSEELFTCIKSGKCRLEVTPDSTGTNVSSSHLLRVYRRRAEHLKGLSTQRAQSIYSDVVTLCETLEKAEDEEVQLWLFSMPPYFEYSVFEGSGSGKILSCILAVDRRLIDEEGWQQLWGIQKGRLAWTGSNKRVDRSRRSGFRLLISSAVRRPGHAGR